MAERDIPPYVEFSPGGLIRSDDHNTVQRRTRDSVRTHRHTRVAGQPADDGRADDSAVQIATEEIADGAVTAVKLAPGAVTAESIFNGAITDAKVPDDSLSVTKLRRAAAPVDVEVQIDGQQTRRITLGNPEAFYLVSVQGVGLVNIRWNLAVAPVDITLIPRVQLLVQNIEASRVTVRVRAYPVQLP